jgi:hypothetical protein
VKVGDVVRIKSIEGWPMGILMSESRRRLSFMVRDVLVKGSIVTLAVQVLELISESR